MESPKPAGSFIPKKPITHSERPRRRRRGGYGFALLGWLIFIVTATIGGAVYYYHSDISTRVDDLVRTLDERRQAFALEELDELAAFDAKLQAVDSLIDDHVAFSNFLTYLEEKTVRSVGFTDYELSGNPGGSYTLSLSARARDYASFALQSEIFREHPSLSQFEYQDIGLDEESGDALFTIDMVIRPDMLEYTGDVVTDFAS